MHVHPIDYPTLVDSEQRYERLQTTLIRSLEAASTVGKLRTPRRTPVESTYDKRAQVVLREVIRERGACSRFDG